MRVTVRKSCMGAALLMTVLLTAVPLSAQTRAAAPVLSTTTEMPEARKGISERGIKLTFTLDDGTTQTIDVVTITRDSTAGLPTGKRMHKPFVITKELDKSSPLLYRLVQTKQPVKQAVLTLDPAAVGKTAPPGTASPAKVVLQDLHFIAVAKVSPTTERVTFEYASAQATSPTGGLTDLDDWSPR